MADPIDYSQQEADGSVRVKLICLGDSAVGKSKLVERFLMNEYNPQRLSTYALTLFQHKTALNGKPITVDLWDTAGQERFNNLHPTYYHQAHACIFVFDVTRKITYKNLQNWYNELAQYRPNIPCLCVANKIDADMSVTKKTFKFATKYRMPLYFVSASDGTNVVRVFRDAIRAAVTYKEQPSDVLDLLMLELERVNLPSSTSAPGSATPGKRDSDLLAIPSSQNGAGASKSLKRMPHSDNASDDD